MVEYNLPCRAYPEIVGFGCFHAEAWIFPVRAVSLHHSGSCAKLLSLVCEFALCGKSMELLNAVVSGEYEQPAASIAAEGSGSTKRQTKCCAPAILHDSTKGKMVRFDKVCNFLAPILNSAAHVIPQTTQSKTGRNYFCG